MRRRSSAASTEAAAACSAEERQPAEWQLQHAARKVQQSKAKISERQTVRREHPQLQLRQKFLFCARYRQRRARADRSRSLGVITVKVNDKTCNTSNSGNWRSIDRKLGDQAHHQSRIATPMLMSADIIDRGSGSVLQDWKSSIKHVATGLEDSSRAQE